MQIVIVTGMSGSGKSSAMDVLEDIGYYCIDNLPPQLLGKFIDICRQTENKIEKLAISVDLRSGKLFGDAYHVLRTLEKTPELDVKVLYLEATDEVIIKRYKETRRKHPLDERFNGSLHSAIAYEREQLLPVKGIADYYIESSYISAAQLKKQIKDIFLDHESDSLLIKVMSFGFKYGASTEADLMFDVRCLPNPYYIPELKTHTGCEACVQDYVLSFEQSQELLKKLEDLLDFLIPLYIKEGKSRLVIAFGCTGGKHRSVTFAEQIGDHLLANGMRVSKQHRDIGRDRPS
ncbi:MAG: RNase adapter RapZ [Ruminococcus sp.]|nr:RNase adapter RapZ [Ruminococcus sp.]